MIWPITFINPPASICAGILFNATELQYSFCHTIFILISILTSMAKSALSSLLSRAHQFSSLSVQATQSSMEPKNNSNYVYKELGLFSLKKKIEDVVNRVEMTTPIALEIEEIKRIKQEEMLMNYNLWDDLARSNESLKSLASSIKVVNELKDLRYKAEEAKLISELVEMDIINGQLFKQAYKASVDVSKLLDRYEMTKLLSGQFDKEGACIIINSGPGVNSEIWAEKLLTMYINWSKRYGYECRVSEKYPSKNGGDGIRSATLEFEKEFAYGYLSGEKGVHNMIRSSLDGSVIREKFSAAIDVIPLFLESHPKLHIDDKELETSSEALQHESKFSLCTVSVRHIPSGITFQCSGERSRFANKLKAMNRLKAKLLVLAKEQGVIDVSKLKGENRESKWENEVRKYVFRPYKLVQDLRTGIHIPNLNSVLNGNIDSLISGHIVLRHGRDIVN